MTTAQPADSCVQPGLCAWPACSPAPFSYCPCFSNPCRYVRIFQVCLMAFVVATCYLNVGKDTLDDGGCSFFLFKCWFKNLLRNMGLQF